MGLKVFMSRPDQAGCRRYQPLRGDDDGEEVLVGDSGRWVKASSWLPLRRRRRRAVPVLFRMSRGRAGGGFKIKVRLMRLVILVPARRAAALFAELMRRIASAAAECPAIVFSSHWGLPVVSHSASVGGASRTAQLRAFYLERSLCSGGAGSPC